MICRICPTEFVSYKNRQKYCPLCQKSGAARKDSLHRYGQTDKKRITANRYNRSQKGKLGKQKWYQQNREEIIKKQLTTYRKETISRTNAHDRVKALIKERFCFVCKVTENIVVHHIDRDPFNNHLSNLILLCRKCHGEEHEMLNQDRSNLTLLGQPFKNIKEFAQSRGLISPD